MKSCTRVILIFTTAFVLTGCEFRSAPQPEPSLVTPMPDNAPAAPSEEHLDSGASSLIAARFEDETQASAATDSESLHLERCKAQLDALKTMAPDKYPRLNNAFRYIMRGAADYAAVRDKTSSETQDTIDSLYHYRSTLICSQISQAMMNSLSLHGALPQ